jgi:hypothetical protein
VKSSQFCTYSCQQKCLFPCPKCLAVLVCLSVAMWVRRNCKKVSIFALTLPRRCLYRFPCPVKKSAYLRVCSYKCWKLYGNRPLHCPYKQKSICAHILSRNCVRAHCPMSCNKLPAPLLHLCHALHEVPLSYLKSAHLCAYSCQKLCRLPLSFKKVFTPVLLLVACSVWVPCL